MVVAALILVILTGIYFLIQRENPRLTRKQKAWLKVIPTSLCALLALYGALKGGGASPWFLFAGLCVCALADWLLEFWFFKGMAAFGMGHILYCIGYLLAGPVHIRSLIVFLALFGIILILYGNLRKKLDQAPLYLCYAVLLCSMAALAASRQSYLMIGGFLFVISDCMIGIGQATKNENRLYSIVILVTYYAAQFLIACSAAAA